MDGVIHLQPRCGMFGSHATQEPIEEQEMSTPLTQAQYEQGMQQFREKLKGLGDEILRDVEKRIADHQVTDAPVTFSSTPRSANEMSQAEAVQLVDWAVEYDKGLVEYAAQGISFERFARLNWNEEHGVGFGAPHKFNAPLQAAIEKRDRQFAAKLVSVSNV